MKTIIVLLLLTLCTFCQDINILKQKDTIYIVLEETDSLVVKQFEKFSLQYSNNGSMIYYQFNESPVKNILLWIQDDTKFPDRPMNITVKRKQFLKLHKDAMIDLDFIVKNGIKTTLFEILNIEGKKKTVYVIYKA